MDGGMVGSIGDSAGGAGGGTAPPPLPVEK